MPISERRGSTSLTSIESEMLKSMLERFAGEAVRAGVREFGRKD